MNRYNRISTAKAIIKGDDEYPKIRGEVIFRRVMDGVPVTVTRSLDHTSLYDYLLLFAFTSLSANSRRLYLSSSLVNPHNSPLPD